MSTIACSCDNVIEVDFPSTVDLAASPNAEESILKGDFMSVVCAKCGRILKPELTVRIRHDERGIDWYMIPELERNAFMLGRVEPPDSAELVVGFRELVERLRLAREGLDPRVNEMAKYYLAQKADAGDELSIYFEGLEEDHAVFHIHGLREGEIGVARVKLATIGEMNRDIERVQMDEPFRTIFERPYVSINKIAIDRED